MGRGDSSWNNGLPLSAPFPDQSPTGQPPRGDCLTCSPRQDAETGEGWQEVKCARSELTAFAQFKSGSRPSVQSTSLFDSCHLILEDFSQGGGGESSETREAGGGGFIQADTTGFQAKCLSGESSWLQLTFLRQEINKWAELEKQIMLPPALGNPQQLSWQRRHPRGGQKRQGETQIALIKPRRGPGKSGLPTEMKGANAGIPTTPALPSQLLLSVLRALTSASQVKPGTWR